MGKFKSAYAVMAIAAVPGLAGVASAAVAPGFNTFTVGACDDCATGFTPTTFAENFFGTTYNGFYISNNGYLTFNGGQGAYTPSGLGAGYSGQPIIAPFFADVDTRGTGTVTYGAGTYAGRDAYGVTWNAVGYYSGQTDKTNTFQTILTDRSDVGVGDFDIYFNYNNISWETGSASGGQNGFGGVSAAVGFNAGQGNAPDTFYELNGSRTPGSFLNSGTTPLVTVTNDGHPSQLLFQVRSGAVVVTPTGSVPEPASWAMMVGGFGLVGSAMRRRRASVSFG